MVSTPTAELNATAMVSNHLTVALIINQTPPFSNPFRTVLLAPVKKVTGRGFELGDRNAVSVAGSATEPLLGVNFFVCGSADFTNLHRAAFHASTASGRFSLHQVRNAAGPSVLAVFCMCSWCVKSCKLSGWLLRLSASIWSTCISSIASP
jgi:hypothetical protein